MPKAKCGSNDSSNDGSDERDQADGAHTEHEEDSEQDTDEEQLNHIYVLWTGYGKKIPIVVFNADAVVTKNPNMKQVGEKYHMAFKIVKTECKLVRSILTGHGFHEVHPNSNDYNMMWTGSHLKPYVLRGMLEFQKINHFPRSYEITRKDRLFKNLQRMQQTKGFRNFDVVPQSYITPGEFQDFCSAFLKDKGPWIVKPVASSRGRGIFLINHPEQVPLDETMIVCRYLANPLVVDGFKFDVRLYVAVTSFDPLIIYLYEEGLTRFATVQYDKSNRSIRNQCMHLTNYSVNKKSNSYVRNDDAEVEDYGNKWSLGALLRYLRSQGKDTTALMMRIEDVVIKTLISAELPIATACKMFMPHRGNCFELYGFDILVDDTLRPWVLEVNLSPSLACDAPLDLKIKSNMVSDLFSIVGFTCQDPMVRKMQQQSRGNSDMWSRPPTRAQHSRPTSASTTRSKTPSGGTGNSKLTGDEIRIVRRAKEEYQRRGGWVRIFPSEDSWELYGSFLQHSTTNNVMLYQQLFPDRAQTISLRPTTAGYSSSLVHTRKIHLHSAAHPHYQSDVALSHAIQRTLQYERKLACLGDKRGSGKTKPVGTGAPNINGKFKGVLVQGIPQENKTSKPVSQKSAPSLKPNNTTTHETHHQKPPLLQGPTTTTAKSKSIPGQTVEDEHAKSPQLSSSRENLQDQLTDQVESPKIEDGSSKPKVKAAKRPSDYNVVQLLEKGKTMSKVQARFAFAMYLMRVQHRLLSESVSQEQDNMEAANEQMDLVLRFLKRAACNLHQPFKVIVPSRKLILNDRRRILAKQLGDFVHIYGKETEELQQHHQLEKKVMKHPPKFSQNDGLDEEKFNKFVHSARESELEDVLTTYTKLNKSASIFLGSKEGTPQNSSPLTSSQPYGSSAGLKGDREYIKQSTTQLRASSAYATVVSTRARPASASSQRSTARKNRPLSASSREKSGSSKSLPPAGVREQPDGAECNPDEYEQENINAALHRLSLRQQQRQYSATRSSSILPNDNDNTPQPTHDPYPSAPQLVSALEKYSCTSDITNPSDDDTLSMKSRRTSHSDSTSKSKAANDTLNGLISEKYTDRQLAAAYNQVTGVDPMNATDYRPTAGSTQYKVFNAQSGVQDLKLSKSIHHQLIAQAHAAHQTGHGHSQVHEEGLSQHKSVQGSFGSLGLGDLVSNKSVVLPPRPPQKSITAKKLESQHRLSRLVMAEELGQ